MTEVVLTFETQTQADACIIALSKGYEVKQWYMPVNAGCPYCVKVFVPNGNVTQISEE